jgi:putative peptidoglycan lipid II flippase
MIRGILTVGGWTMVSRVLGFVRDMLIASHLGAGLIADAFFVALRLPNLFRRLFGEGAFNAAFIPHFTALHARDGIAPARVFASSAFAFMASALGGLTVLGLIVMPAIVSGLAPGFAGVEGKFELAVALSRITFPYLPLICLAALLAGILNALGRFGVAAASYVLFNVCTIATLLGLTPLVATGGHALAWGVLIAGVSQLTVLWIACARAGAAPRPAMPRLTPDLRLLLRRMAPGVVGGGITQVNLAVDVIIASLLPAGTVSVLYYADRIQQLPLSVIGSAIGSALLPALSRQLAAGQDEAAMETQNRAITYALLLTLPAALALVVIAWPIIWALFGRGAFDLATARLTAQALAMYAIGLPAFVMIKVLAPGFFARGDTTTPMVIAGVMVGAHLALNLAFMEPLGHLGPPLATSLVSIIIAVWFAITLRRRGHARLDPRLPGQLGRMTPPLLAMGVALWAGGYYGFDAAAGGTVRLLVLAGLTGGGLAIYGLGLWVMGLGSPKAVMAALRRR